MSLFINCSWRLMVLVEITTRWPLDRANKADGNRYDIDLPTPVPPSTTRCSLWYMALATLVSICSCSGRCSKPEKAFAKGPFWDRSPETISSERSFNFGSARRFSGVPRRLDRCSRSNPVSPTDEDRVSPSPSNPDSSPLIDQRLRAARLER